MGQLTKYKPNQLLAIELYSSNPGITQKELANKCGVDVKTIRNWLSNPEFIDQIYKRYMEISGLELPAIIKAMLEEAKMGNVQAGRLILEHYGKLENRVKIQVESPFEKFLRSDSEEAEFIDVSEQDKSIIDNFAVENSLSSIDLPERDPQNDNPARKAAQDVVNLKNATKFEMEKEKKKQYQKNAYEMRKRAKKVGLELLGNGRHTKGERKKWLEELERLEKEQNA
tara:strand:+ start:836 stop:1516 length:681 start_codon:yes stop_codon:yes gene_type:complete